MRGPGAAVADRMARCAGPVPQDSDKCWFSQLVPSTANTQGTRPTCQHADTHTLSRPLASWPAFLPRSRLQYRRCAPAMCLRRTGEPGAAHVTGETLVSTVSSREACIDAVAAAPTATCPEPKIANMLADYPSGNSPCYCQTGTDTTPGPVCAAAAAARRLPALRWPCCLVCACVLGSVPRLLPDALAPSVSPRTPPACIQILPHSTPAASSPSREAPRLLRLFFRAIWAKRVRNWAIVRTVRLESTNLW